MCYQKVSSSRSLCKGPVPRMKKSMALFHIKNFSCHVTLLLKRKLQHVGHKWVICGSHPDCSVGQWVKWINRCDLLSTLIQVAYVEMITDAKMFEIVIITLSLHLWELLIVLRLATVNQSYFFSQLAK